MAERITKAGRELLALHQGNGTHCKIDKFILAYVPGQNPADEIDPDRGLPSAGQIVHEQSVTRDGYLAPDMVSYSLYMDAKTGPFTFNTIYTVSTVNSNTVMQIITVPDTPKIADDPGNSVRGQPMVRNAVLVYDDAAAITNITIEAEAWQWDFEDATETIKGFIEIATQSEVNAGTDHQRAVTSKTLKSRLASFTRNATETVKGFVEIATQTEANGSSDDSRAITAKKLYNRTATESRRGVAEVATQAEADAGTDDSRIITSKKLWSILTSKFARKDVRPTFSQGINTGGKPIIYSGSGTNVDHIWYDDGGNEFHLVADKEEGSNGNANLKLGGIQLTSGARATAVSDSATSSSTFTLAASKAVKTARDDGTRQATESQRGQATVASQPTVDGGENHTAFVTPRTLKKNIDKQFVGVVVGFPTTSPPTGWIKHNGAELSRTAYAALWAFAQASGNLVSQSVKNANPDEYQNAFGTGNGSTTFTIGDSRGEFFRALDDSRGIDASRQISAHQADQVKSHSHRFGNRDNSGGFDFTPYQHLSLGRPPLGGTHQEGKETYSVTSFGGDQNLVRNVSLLFCIKF